MMECDSDIYKGTCTPIFVAAIYNRQAMEVAKMPHYQQMY
jgi:hypothetical protein